MKIRIDSLDILFSQFIRLRDKVCQRCFAQGNSIACAHFHGRSSKSVRWDEDNACALCLGCHSYLDGHPVEKVEFFQQRLGQEKFDLLGSRARTPARYIDKQAITVYLKLKIKELA